jgi:hypothetical protein
MKEKKLPNPTAKSKKSGRYFPSGRKKTAPTPERFAK